MDAFDFILSMYGKKLSNVNFIVGDNCSTNKALADQMYFIILLFFSFFLFFNYF